MELLDAKAKVRTKLLKTATLDTKHTVTIEKVLDGEYKDRYVVKSYVKTLIGKRATTMAAYNIETDLNGNRVVFIEFPLFVLVKQASEYLAFVKSHKYKKFLKLNK